MPSTQPWEERFDTPHKNNCDIEPSPHLCKCMKEDIEKIISSERAKLLKEIEEKIDESPLCLRDYNILKSLLNSMK